MSFELEMLQVVVMPGQVEVDLVLAQQRIPLVDQGLVIAVRSV